MHRLGVVCFAIIARLRCSVAVWMPSRPTASQRLAPDVEVEAPAALSKLDVSFQSSLRDPKNTARAKMFESAHCQQWKTKADVRHWGRSNVPHPLMLEKARRTLTCSLHSGNVTYVRNPKAASTYMWDNFPEMFGCADPQIATPYLKVHDGGEAFGQAPDLTSEFVFTVIRDPIDTAVSAYLEVSDRRPLLQYPLPAFANMPCDTGEQATARFMKYLSDARAGVKVSTEFFHSYPQALKIDVDLKKSGQTSVDGVSADPVMDSIVKMENMANDLKAVPGFAGILPARSENSDHPHAQGGCSNISLDDKRLMAQLCDMYRVDFECFDYALPAACR